MKNRNMKKLLFAAVAFSCSGLIASAFTTDTAAGYWSENGKNSGLTKTDSNGGFTLSGADFTSPTASREAVTFSFTIDPSSLNVGTGTDLRLFYLDGDRGDFGIGFDAETDKLSFTWNTDYDYGTFGDALTNNSGIKTFTVSFGDKGTRAWDENGNYWSSFRLKGDIDNANVDSVVVTQDGSNALGGITLWNKAISFSETGTTNTGVSSAAMATQAMKSVIPEPSAFGLLAGLGALALVGARHRRKA